MSKIYSRVALDDASGVSFIDRIGGQVQVSNDAGATFAPPGGGNLITLADASTTQTPDALVVNHTTSATAAAGFGETIGMGLQNAAGTLKRAINLIATWVDPTNATENSKLLIQSLLAGAATTAMNVGYNAITSFPFMFLGATLNGFLQTGTFQFQAVLNNTAYFTFDSNQNFSNTRLNFNKGPDAASATTLTLGAGSTGGNYYKVTGTTTVNGITTASWNPGAMINLELASGITITHNSGAPGGGAVAILLRAGANLTTASVYYLTLWYNGTNWVQPF